MEGRPADLLGAELAKMFCYKLSVEQAEPPVFEARYQVNQGDLAGVCLVGEHALAEKSAPEGNAVKAADKLSIPPRLDGVAITHVEQLGVELPDASVDPGGAAPGPQRRTRSRARIPRRSGSIQ
jgi:hypothetical protein